MRTLTANKASQNLGEWLDRAIRGEEIGIVHSPSGKVVALRPVEIQNADADFARECAKLDAKLERAMAEEGLSEDFAAWPKY